MKAWPINVRWPSGHCPVCQMASPCQNEVSNKSIFEAFQAVLMRFDEQDKRLQIFESRIEANSKAVEENKENIGKCRSKLRLWQMKTAPSRKCALKLRDIKDGGISDFWG